MVANSEILWDRLLDGRKIGGAPASFAFRARAHMEASVIGSAVGDDEQSRAIPAVRLLCLDPESPQQAAFSRDLSPQLKRSHARPIGKPTFPVKLRYH